MINDCKYLISDEKINQNVDRLHTFLCHELGCSKQDIQEVFKRFTKKYDLNKESSFKVVKRKTLINHKRFDFARPWVEYIKNTPEIEWRSKFKEFIDAQFEDIKNFREYCREQKRVERTR